MKNNNFLKKRKTKCSKYISSDPHFVPSEATQIKVIISKASFCTQSLTARRRKRGRSSFLSLELERRTKTGAKHDGGRKATDKQVETR